MAYLKLDYGDGRSEVREVQGEVRLEDGLGSSVTFNTLSGLTSASYDPGDGLLEIGEPDWDDPATRRKLKKLLQEAAPPVPAKLTVGFSDGSEAERSGAGEPRLNVGLGQSITFGVDSLVSVEMTDEEPKEKGKKK